MKERINQIKKQFEGQNKLVLILSSTLVVVFMTLVILTLYEHFKNDNIIVIKKVVRNNGLMLRKTDYYVANGSEIVLKLDNPHGVKYKINVVDDNIVSNENGKLIAKNIGETNFTIEIENFQAFSGKIYVVNGMAIPGEKFNKSKKFISCNEFSDDENKLLDDALKDRIEQAGYETRAGVVAAARFITMEFDRRIPYFYENGRLNNHERKHVDGEGRYYHKGLYLSKSKYKDLDKSWTGPGSWGCKILQFEPAEQYGFVKNTKMPNGLDCSGFVSWILYNGGFDVKDTAAGDTARKDELYDLGEKRYLNQDLINSGEVKVGDLIAYQGHMALIAGIDDVNKLYYVVESLPNFKGVVMNKYTHEGLKATFTHIMLMDSVYLMDGNLTNMWY